MRAWVPGAGCRVLGAGCWAEALRLSTQHSAPGTQHPVLSTHAPL